MSIEISVLNAMATTCLHKRPRAINQMNALVVTDTNDRSSGWAMKFAENMGLHYVGWNWDKKLSAWNLVLQQISNGKLPMAEINLIFAAGEFGYLLSLIEYQPLFWMSKKVKFGPEVTRRQPVQEAVYTADNGRDIAALIKKLSFACKDDIDPTDRVVRLLNEVGRAYQFTFSSVKKDEIEIEVTGMDLLNDYLKPLEAFGYTTKMFMGTAPDKRRLVIETPTLHKGK
jgi:hypothetical protein